MQVAGRAARHVNGRVLLYGDKISDAMQYLLDESNRRRKAQREYNKKHGITPKTIYKSLDEVMISTAVADSAVVDEAGPTITQIGIDVEEGDTRLMIDLLRREMQKAAENLEFERAATLRDEIRRLEKELEVEV